MTIQHCSLSFIIIKRSLQVDDVCFLPKQMSQQKHVFFLDFKTNIALSSDGRRRPKPSERRANSSRAHISEARRDQPLGVGISAVGLKTTVMVLEK